VEPPTGECSKIGESFEAGVRREVAEETDIPVAVGRLTGVYQNMSRAVVALVFRCRPLANQPHPTDEATSVRWGHPDEIARLMDSAHTMNLSR
jgi:8-oxo-dGTP diphosphatase